MSGFLEYLRRHITWCSACGRKNMESFLIHNSRKPKVCDQEICIIFGCSKEEIFGLEITVDDAVVVEVSDGGEGGADEFGGVGFVVASFPAYTVEEFTAEGEIGDEVD